MRQATRRAIPRMLMRMPTACLGTMRRRVIAMPTQTTPSVLLIFQALAGGGGLMGAVLFLRDWVVSAEKKRREA